MITKLFAKTLLARDPIHTNAATQGHMRQLPAAATEFIEFTDRLQQGNQMD